MKQFLILERVQSLQTNIPIYLNSSRSSVFCEPLIYFHIKYLAFKSLSKYCHEFKGKRFSNS